MDRDPAGPIRVLILDGGDRRALSQLEILDKIMHRVEFDKRAAQRILPHKYFHAIAGVGPGGVLVAFLGILRMSIEEAQNEFISLYEFVFEKDADDEDARSLKFQEFIKDLLVRKGFEANMPLQQTDSEGCHVFLGCSFYGNITKFQVLRGYKSRDGPTKMTLVEALRATWADPEVFAPVNIGEEHIKIKYVGCDATFRSPAREAIKEALRIYGRERRVACAISLGSGMTSSPPGAASFERKLSAQVHSERTVAELQGQWGSTGVYYRFSISIGDRDSRSFANILESASAYILEQEKALDTCACAVDSAMSRITLEDLCHSPTSIPRTSPQLPRLSSYFMDRPHVIEKMNDIFSRKRQDLMIISGMGGIGKTQIARKWAGDHANEFVFIMFIDASSQETLEADLVSGVNGLIGSRGISTSKEALRILSGTGDGSLKNGLIVFDNADDPDLDLARFIPTSDGYNIVTTRNQRLQSLAPEAYMELEVMPEDEATKLLFKVAKMKTPTKEELEQATAIVQGLEFLPLAIVQAGSYIGEWHCIDNYLDKLKKSRARLLARPMGPTLDKGHRAVYAALDVTIPSLSNKVKQVLQILCFLRPMRISSRFIQLAAENGFSLQLPDLLPQSTAHEEILPLLRSLFSPSDPELDTQDLINDLQRYSLVTLTEDKETLIILRFHRLVLAWAHDQLMQVGDRDNFQSAALCLLLTGTQEYSEEIMGDIAPHVLSLSSSPTWKQLQTNYRAAFLKVLRTYSNGGDLVRHWKEIQSELVAADGNDDLRNSEVSLQLADAHWRNGDEEVALELEADVVELRRGLLGPEDPSTLSAMERQALGHYNLGSFTCAAELQESILKTRWSLSSTSPRQLAPAIEDLAETYKALGRFGEAKELLMEALDLWNTIYSNGHSNIRKIKESINELDACEDADSDLEILDENGLVEERQRIYIGWRPWEIPHEEVWNGVLGELSDMTNLERDASFSLSKGRFDQAQIYREAILKLCSEKYGFGDRNTIEAIELLAQLYERQDQKLDAIIIRLWGTKRVLHLVKSPGRKEKSATTLLLEALLSAQPSMGQPSMHPINILIVNIIKPEAAQYLDQVIKHQTDSKGIDNTPAICVLEKALESICHIQNLSDSALQQMKRASALILALEIPISLTDSRLLEDVLRALGFALQPEYLTLPGERVDYSPDDHHYELEISQHKIISYEGNGESTTDCRDSVDIMDLEQILVTRGQNDKVHDLNSLLRDIETVRVAEGDTEVISSKKFMPFFETTRIRQTGNEQVPRSYRCAFCDYQIGNRTQIIQHLMRRHFFYRPYKCDIWHSEKKFPCSCGKSYTNDRNRRRHQRHSKSCFFVD